MRTHGKHERTAYGMNRAILSAWILAVLLHSSSPLHSIWTTEPLMQIVPTSWQIDVFFPQVWQGVLSQIIRRLFSITNNTIKSSFDSLLAISATWITFIAHISFTFLLWCGRVGSLGCTDNAGWCRHSPTRSQPFEGGHPFSNYVKMLSFYAK